MKQWNPVSKKFCKCLSSLGLHPKDWDPASFVSFIYLSTWGVVLDFILSDSRVVGQAAPWPSTASHQHLHFFPSWEEGPSMLPQLRQLCQDCDAVQPWQCVLPAERVWQSPEVSAPGEAQREKLSPLIKQPAKIWNVCLLYEALVSFLNIGILLSQV
jgi:hypothetical protein